MKKLLFSIALLSMFAFGASAQSSKDIKLSAPNTERGLSIMKTLSVRHSVRECNGKQLSNADLSDLLWAANGINRKESGMRTAPSAMNRQDVDVYAVMEKGIYKYVPSENLLKLVVEGDHRDAVATRQDFVKQFPLSLVLVTDISKFGGRGDRDATMGAIDAGIVCENICLFCAGNGLVTVPRASMDYDKLKTLLNLNDKQLLMMNNPVGYPVEK
jgi:nitroreductase